MHPEHMETTSLYTGEYRTPRDGRLVQIWKTQNVSTQTSGKRAAVEDRKEKLVSRYVW